jgi:hypothetical protein
MKYVRTKHPGVCCPKCGCRHVPATGAYRIADGVTRRYRECRNCGYRFCSRSLTGTICFESNVTVSTWVGFAYDGVSRNSNTYVGSVLRRAKVDLPKEAKNLFAINNTFTTWRQWELALQKQFQDAADAHSAKKRAEKAAFIKAQQAAPKPAN